MDLSKGTGTVVLSLALINPGSGVGVLVSGLGTGRWVPSLDPMRPKC